MRSKLSKNYAEKMREMSMLLISTQLRRAQTKEACPARQEISFLARLKMKVLLKL